MTTQLDHLRYAVVGNPIEHSRSPEIHQSFAGQFALELSYERLLAPKTAFEPTIEAFFAAGGCGLNVTVPFKGAAAAWCDELAPAAATVNAVNTIRRTVDSDGAERFEGTNTDGAGLLMDLERLGWPVRAARVLLLGAGGAARGALFALLEHGPASVTVANRTLATAHALCKSLEPQAMRYGSVLYALSLAQVAERFDLVINATSLGLEGSEAAFASALPTFQVANSRCYDMVYGGTGEGSTAFLRFAQSRGAGAIADGFGMLIGQAAVAFEWWHGQRPDVALTLAELA